MFWRAITIILLAVQLMGLLVLLSTVFALSFVHGPTYGGEIYWGAILSSWEAIVFTLIVGVSFALLLTHRVFPRAAIIIAGLTLAIYLYDGALSSFIQSALNLHLDIMLTIHQIAPFSAAYILSGKKWHEKWFKKKKR